MDAATFVVNMIDKVSGPSLKAAGSVDKLRDAYGRFVKAENQWHGPPGSKLTDRLNRQEKLSRIGKRFTGRVDKGLSGFTDGLVKYGKYAALALGAAGVAAAAFAIKGVVHMGMFADASKRAFGFLTGDASKGNEAFDHAVQLAKSLGMDVEDVTHKMQKMMALQFTLGESETFVKLGADLRAVGATADAVGRVLLDITHIKATGFVSGREMRSLANAGVSVQLINEEIGKAMGIDPKKVHEAITKKKVTADIALPAIQRAIMRKTHEHAAGEAGKSFANNTLTGLVEQLQNAPSQFFLRVSKAADASIMKLKPLVASIMREIDAFDVSQMARFVGSTLDMMRALVPLAGQFIAGFMEGMSAINDVMGTVDPAKASLQTARDLGRALADAFAFALKTLQKMADLLIWMDKHRTATLVGASVLGVTRVAGAASMVTGTITAVGWIVKAVKWTAMLFSATGAIATAWASVSLAVEVVLTMLGAIIGVSALAMGAIIGGVAIAIAAAGYAIYAYWDEIKAFFVSLGSWFADIGKRWGAALWDGIKNAFSSIKSMLGFTTVQGVQGLGAANQIAASQAPVASQAPAATPTPALAAAQKNGFAQTVQNSVRTGDIIVSVDGKDKDNKQLGQDVGDAVHERIHQQFWQSQALEAGAAGAE